MIICIRCFTGEHHHCQLDCECWSDRCRDHQLDFVGEEVLRREGVL